MDLFLSEVGGIEECDSWAIDRIGFKHDDLILPLPQDGRGEVEGLLRPLIVPIAAKVKAVHHNEALMEADGRKEGVLRRALDSKRSAIEARLSVKGGMESRAKGNEGYSLRLMPCADEPRFHTTRDARCKANGGPSRPDGLHIDRQSGQRPSQERRKQAYCNK